MDNEANMATQVEWKEEWDRYLSQLEEESGKNKNELASWLNLREPRGSKIKRSYVVLENLSMWTIRILAKPSSIEGYDCNIFVTYEGEKDTHRPYPRPPSAYVENRHAGTLAEALDHAASFVERCETLENQIHEQARTETMQEVGTVLSQHHEKPWWKFW